MTAPVMVTEAVMAAAVPCTYGQQAWPRAQTDVTGFASLTMMVTVS